MENKRTAPDDLLVRIAHYVTDYEIKSDEAYQTARACLADSLGCAILALKFKECTKLLGPVTPGTVVPHGCRVPGTDFILDPIRGAFNIGTMIRWLDFNDTWLGMEWAHPSDNLGGILAVADYISRRPGESPIYVRDLLKWMIKAHEIQGQFSILNSFNRVGLDHVILVKIATTAIVTHMMGGTKEQIIDALSNAWIDTGPLRTYRHAPNTGSRKSWAAGDATSRGVFLADITLRGEMGYPTALTAPQWGFYDVIMKGNPFAFQLPFGSYIMENILFKAGFPAEFHAQTAVECAVQLHPIVKNQLEQIDHIKIETHESAIRIIDKKGPLHNPADRDHCIQYMTAIGLIMGNLNAEDYEEEASKDPRIDQLRDKIEVVENKEYTRAYHQPEKRSIANAITITMKDGTKIPRMEIEYPLGHKQRRNEGIPQVFNKFEANLSTHFTKEKVRTIAALFNDHSKLCDTSVNTLIDLFC